MLPVLLTKRSKISHPPGAVVVTNAKSLEAVSFFFSIIFDTEKPIVVTEDSAYAIPVANNKNATKRGVLSVTSDKLVYSGVFTPPTACSYGAGLPVAIVDDQDEVKWFFDASKPTLISSDSIIRKEYSNFTDSLWSIRKRCSNCSNCL